VPRPCSGAPVGGSAKRERERSRKKERSAPGRNCLPQTQTQRGIERDRRSRNAEKPCFVPAAAGSGNGRIEVRCELAPMGTRPDDDTAARDDGREVGRAHRPLRLAELKTDGQSEIATTADGTGRPVAEGAF